MSLARNQLFLFGEFELSVSARHLMRNGKPVPLGSKAFEVLVCLVVHAGELVTKDELLRTVWPESFVEETNLPQHVFALRRALGDRASYIVTIPGRGYQFTERVKRIAELPPIAPADPPSFLLQRTRESMHIVIEETSTASPSPASENVTVQRSIAEHVPPPHPPRARRLSYSLLAFVSIAALLTGAFAFHIFAKKTPGSQRIVLAEFENRTGDPGFDVVLRNALEIDLDQSPYLDVMSEHEELDTLRLMGQEPNTAFAPTVAREVCERSNRHLLITGSVASVGQKYLVTLEATDCDSGKILAGAKAEANNKEQTLVALDSASTKLRDGLGESAESLRRFQVPIAQATTASLEALKQYSIGEYLLGRMGKEEREVLPFFQRAAELDPHFAMAQVAIATSYYRLGELELADAYYQKAFDLCGQTSEKERLYIRAHYYADDKQDIKQGIQTYQMWTEVYPRDWGPWLDLAIEYSQLGQFDTAIAAAEHALNLDPTRGIIYSVLARNYMHAGRYPEAKLTALRALSMGKNSSLLHATLFETALLDHDRQGMEQEIAQSKEKEGEWDLLNLQALAAAKDGRYRHAEQLFQTAYEAALHEGLQERANDILLSQAASEFDGGMVEAARTTFNRVKPNKPSNHEVAFLQAELGDTSSAQRAIGTNGGQDDSGTLSTYVYEPLIRARIALNQGKPQEAINYLQPAAEHEFIAGFAIIAERGDAYLMAKEPDKAAIEYRKILDHQGVDPVSPLFPLASLGLARAELQAGHIDQSKAAYQTLFDQWKQADADLPILLTARREYAMLPAEHKQ